MRGFLSLEKEMLERTLDGIGKSQKGVEEVKKKKEDRDRAKRENREKGTIRLN